jgi:hypothetical protein
LVISKSRNGSNSMEASKLLDASKSRDASKIRKASIWMYASKSRDTSNSIPLPELTIPAEGPTIHVQILRTVLLGVMQG